MPICHSCGETVNDESDICPHCFSKVTAPGVAPVDVNSIDVNSIDVNSIDFEESDEELVLAPIDVDLPEVSDRLPDAATGLADVEDLDETAEAEGCCPNCRETKGAAVDLCTACGYHYGLQRVLTAEDQDELDVGLRRMIRRALNDDTDLTHVSILAHVTLVLMAGIVYVKAPGTRWILIPLVVAYVVFRIVDLVARGRFRRQFGDYVWLTFLKFIRASGRDPRKPTQKLQILVVADGDSYTDQDLFSIESTLNKYDVVDLEGASITDAGTVALFAKPNIRYINLRNTKVSKVAIRRLQRNHIDAWIWS